MQTVFRCLGLGGSATKLGVWAVVSLLWVVGCGGGSSSSNHNDADLPQRGNDAAGGAGQTDTKTDTMKDGAGGGGSGGVIAGDAPVDQPLLDAPADVPTDRGDVLPGGCTAATDCPGQDTECSKRTCVQGMCGVATLAAGLPVPLQVAGDCKVRQCDDKGLLVTVPDNFDVPDDGNPCTLDVCTAGAPSHTSAPQGQVCGGANKCNASGQCVGCNVAADCPGDDNVCQTRTCVQSVCGFNRVAAGAPIASQTPNDCKVVQCDGQGHTTTVNDNNDKPVDGNACTDDVCSQGTPSNPPLAAGTTCGNGRTCDGAGRCGQCNVAADCGTSNACRTYTCTAQGTCQVAYVASGTALAPAAQSPGDCKSVQCDGQGNTMQVNDDTDVPVDNKPCTKDVCTNGTPSHPPEPVTTVCGTNQHCDGSGVCIGCTMNSDCPTDPCRTYQCTNSACVGTAVGAGTPLPDSGQTAHDCQQKQCDGNGNVASVNDNTDKPADDGNACTVEGCSSGSPTSTFADTSTACTANGGTHCNGAGMCVAPPPAQTYMVLRVDAGAGLGTSAAAAVVVEERTLANPSTVVRTITLPTMANLGSNKGVMLSGSAGSEGWLTRSEDGHYLIVAGYNPTDANQAAKVKSNGAERVVARINASGTVETYGIISTAFITDNLRGATSTNGTDIWAFGDGSTKSGGAWYLAFGTASGVQVIPNVTALPSPTALRACQIVGMKLFCSSDKANFAGVSQVGTVSAPMSSPAQVTLLPGFPAVSSAVPYQFAFVGSDRLYVADDRLPASGGGVQRWTLQNGNWVAGDNFNTGAFGARGALAVTSGNNTTVLVTTADDASGNAAVNHILQFVDTGTGAPTATTIATAPAGSFFRGLALPPQ